MAAKKDRFKEEFEKLRNEILRDRIREAFAKGAGNYQQSLEEIGFTLYDDDYPSEEDEERAAVPENSGQRLLISYFEGKVGLATDLLDALSAEQNSREPNYPLIRKYFRAANQHLKKLILFGLECDPTDLDLLTNLVFFNEFDRNLPELIEHFIRACKLVDDLQAFAEIAREFEYSTQEDGYHALAALQDVFDGGSDKRKVIDFLVNEQERQEREDIPF